MARAPRTQSAQHKSSAEIEKDPVEGVQWIIAILQMIFVALIVVAMTPFTNNLDDIKVTLYLIFGTLMGLIVIGAIVLKIAPPPHRPVMWGLAAYGIVLILSTLLSQHSWAGWPVVIFYFASVGFFLGGVTVGASWKTSYAWFAFAVALAFCTQLLGFFHYDFVGNGKTGTQWLYTFLYGDVMRTRSPSALQALLFTYISDAKMSLMSTVLNRDFFAAFCLLYLPISIGLALIAYSRKLSVLGIVTVLTSMVTVLLCQSKGEYFFCLLQLVFFVVLYALAVRRLRVPWAYLGACVLGTFILMGTIVLMNLPSMMGQLKSVSFSVSSRQIIFSGAWKIFKHFPLLGGGPGTFKVFFPQYRAPNYYEHEISNVTEFAHNYFLDILCETGLAGAITFGFFGVSLAFLAFRALFRSDENSHTRQKIMLVACLTGLLGLYGSNMTSTSMRWPIGAIGLWSIMGFVAGLVRQSEGWKGTYAVAATLMGQTAVRRSPAEGFIDERKPYAKPWVIGMGIGCLVICALAAWEGWRYWSAARSYSGALSKFEYVMRVYSDKLRNPKEMLPADRKEAQALLNESAAEFHKALKVYPEHVSAYYKLGSVENALADVDGANHEKHLVAAKDAYETLNGYFPDYAEVPYNLGIVYYRLSQLGKRKLKQADKASPEAQAQLKAEIALDEERSKQFFERMGTMSKKSDVIFNLAFAYYQAGELELARDSFAQGMKLYPKQDEFPKMLLTVAQDLNDAQSQVDALKSLYLLYPADRPTSHLQRGLDIATRNNLEASFNELLQLGMERNPADPRFYAHQVKHAEQKQDHATAVEAANNYMKLVNQPEIKKLKADGEKDEIAMKAATAAETIGDLTSARRFYEVLALGTSEHAPRAKTWLDSHS